MLARRLAKFGVNIIRNHQMDAEWANLRQGSQEVWVWAVVEATSKLAPVLKFGPHTMDLAYAVVHDLYQILLLGCVPIFTSDGLKLFFYALTAHFRRWQQPVDSQKPEWKIASTFLYAQLKKIHRHQILVRVEHCMLWGKLGLWQNSR